MADLGRPTPPALIVPDRVELPPPLPPRQGLRGGFPTRTVAAFAIPAVGFAAATALTYWLDGPQPAGDAISRWLLFASACSFCAGLVVGLLLSRRFAARAAWTAWGAASPWLASLLVLAAVAAARPLRDRFAARGHERCVAEGRAVCSARMFAERCRSAALPGADGKALLGAPDHESCGPQGCTRRYRYEGPWTPDDYAAGGALICSVVTDANGAPVRYAMGNAEARQP